MGLTERRFPMSRSCSVGLVKEQHMSHGRLKFKVERPHRVDETEPARRLNEHEVHPSYQGELLRRVMWRESHEYQQIIRWRWPTLMFGIIAGLIFAYFWFLTDTFPASGLRGGTRPIVGAYIALFISMLPPY